MCTQLGRATNGLLAIRISDVPPHGGSGCVPGEAEALKGAS